MFDIPLAQGGGLGCPMMVVALAAVAFVTWVVNQISAQNKAAARKAGPRPARPRNDRIQQEIDQFIQEAAGRRPPRKEVLSADEIEIVSPPAAGRRAPARRAAPPATRPVRPAAPSPAAPARPGQAAAQRHLSGPEQLGAGLTDHVRTHMDHRVGAEVQQHLPHKVDLEVNQHLGAFAAQSAGRPSQPMEVAGVRRDATPALLLLGDLRSPGGVRRAIMMQEILQRPRALRHRHR
jgi:hypothetical protein